MVTLSAIVEKYMLFNLKRSHKASASKPWDIFLNSDTIKRIIDVCLALGALVVFSPLLLTCAVVIRSSGARSVTFRQRRVGRHGNPFEILKLTTMKEDAHRAGPLVSTGKDKRVTRVGRIIRAFGFNELPQLINVIRGEMSIVGPRPEVPKYVEQWPQDIKDEVLSLRPGITGLATVKFWHEESFLEGKDDVERAYLEEVLPGKLRTELWYIRNRTFLLDLRIMALTLVKAFGGQRFTKSADSVMILPVPEEKL